MDSTQLQSPPLQPQPQPALAPAPAPAQAQSPLAAPSPAGVQPVVDAQPPALDPAQHVQPPSPTPPTPPVAAIDSAPALVVQQDAPSPPTIVPTPLALQQQEQPEEHPEEQPEQQPEQPLQLQQLAVDAASHVTLAGTPPDPASIPVDPPHGTPPPPTGTLLPDVAAAEDPSVLPTVAPTTFTPPPVTPTPPPDLDLDLGSQPMDEDSVHDEPTQLSPEIAAATPKPDTELTVAHAPLGEAPQPPTLSHQLDLDAGVEQNADVEMLDVETEDTPATANETQPAEVVLATPVPIETETQFQTEFQTQTQTQPQPEPQPEPVTVYTNGNGFVDVTSPNDIPMSAVTTSFPSALDDVDQPPPAKRQKLESSPGAEPVSATTLMAPPPPTTLLSGSAPFSSSQVKYALSIVRSLKKNKDSPPFLLPVDYVALGIPHYPSIIAEPMDLTTVEKKLGGGPKTESGQFQPYQTLDQFVNDVRLVFRNCLIFNGPDHIITQMAKNLEEHFDRLLKNMPAPEEVKPPKVVKKAPPQRRGSMASAPARKEDSYALNRPKREIPAPRDTTSTLPPPPKRRKYRTEAQAEQLKFCQSALKDLHKKQYYNFAFPFYQPVDIVALNIPHYPKVIKKPMDLSTMQSKLSQGLYADAKAFYNDFKLMIKNCFAFNPVGSPVYDAGVQLNELFDEKWQNLPSLHPEYSEDDDEEDSDEDQAHTVKIMEQQIQSLHSALTALKKKQQPKKDKMRKPHPPSIPKPPKVARAAGATSWAAPPQKKKKKPIMEEDDDVLSFEQKKQLSESIQTLDGAKLERVLEIIDEVYPQVREFHDEIELDIDLLPPHVLMKLYNFVIRPTKPRLGRPPNGSAPIVGKLAGTKRKSMDEEAESERIRQLEETLQRLKTGVASADDHDVAAQIHAAQGIGEDSASDSDSDSSSGSDSE